MVFRINCFHQFIVNTARKTVLQYLKQHLRHNT